MADDLEGNLIEVRTFASMEEIKSLPRFRKNNPINTDNYDRIIGDYWFPDEVRCCREESLEHLCGEPHKWGFVARLKDQTITIVGNRCARDKFGADAKIKVDRSKYINEKTRRERFARLEDLLAEKKTRIARLVVLTETLTQIQERIRSFLDPLGDQTRRRLRDMAHSVNAVVNVNAVTYKDYIDENGQQQKERRVAPVRLGFLSGLSIIDEHSFHSLHSSINTINQAFDTANTITEDSKTVKLLSLINTITDTDRLENEVDRIQKEGASFFANDFSLLCFLVDDKPERYKAARVFLGQQGNAVGKDKAKTWLSEKEQKMRETLKADKIEIQH